MGKFFRNGRLISADTVNVRGYRTLTGATEETLWAGTATDRPVPGSEQLRVSSTSVEDDSSKAEVITITITGTMDVAATDVWDCTVGGAVNTGDRIRLTLNGVHYDTDITPGLPNVAAVADEVADAATLGSWDTWTVQIGAGGDENDVITLTVPGAAASPYVHTVTAGQTPTDVATALTALVTADGGRTYDAASAGDTILLVQTTRGAGATITAVWTTDPGLDAAVTVTHTITGVAGQADWTVVSDSIDTVTCTNATPGATGDTVASSYTVDPGGNSTFVAVHTTTGVDADVVAVDDGNDTFSHIVTAGQTTTDVATALAALIDASGPYVASSAANVVTVTGLDGANIAFSDVSTDNQNADLGVAIATTQTSGGGTGIRTLRIDYLDADGVRQSETVSMNGVVAVLTTVTDVTAILAVTAVTSVGSEGCAVGTVSIKDTTGATTFEVVAAGECNAKPGAYVVPARQQAWLAAVHGSASAATEVRVRSDANPATGTVLAGSSYEWAMTHVGTMPGAYNPSYPIGPFPAGATLWMTGKGAGNPTVTASIDAYLEPAGA